MAEGAQQGDRAGADDSVLAEPLTLTRVRARRSSHLLSWAVLAALLAVSAWATHASHQLLQERRAHAFEREAAALQTRLQDQIALYQTLTRTLLGFFQASDFVDRQEWRTYLAAYRLQEAYPHLRHVFFAFDATTPRAGDYFAQMPAQLGLEPESMVWALQGEERHPLSAEQRAAAMPLIYSTPYDAWLIGFDVRSQHAEALERVANSRDATLVGGFRLLARDPERLLFLVPFLRRDRSGTESEGPPEGMIGLVLSSHGLLRQLLAEAPPGLGWEVYLGDRIDAALPLFDSDGIALARHPQPPHFQSRATLRLAGQDFLLVLHAPRFWPVAGLNDWAPLYVAGLGLAIGLLAFAVVRMLESTRERALAMAERMTQELRTVNLMLAQMATTDPLTGLLNRRAFGERLQAELVRSARYGPACALLLLDIDHFKRINDEHGHAAGDTVLRGVAQLLQRQLRGSDAAGRLGGEEFAVLLPHTGREDALRVAESLRGRIAELRFAEGEATLACTTSIGLVVADSAAVAADDLLRQADQALYRAKAAGRDRVVEYSATDAPAG